MSDKQSMEHGVYSEPTVLLIGVFEEDRVPFLGRLCNGPLEALAVRTCRQGLTVLQRRAISVVVCERDLPDGTWKDILKALEALRTIDAAWREWTQSRKGSRQPESAMATATVA